MSGLRIDVGAKDFEMCCLQKKSAENWWYLHSGRYATTANFFASTGCGAVFCPIQFLHAFLRIYSHALLLKYPITQITQTLDILAEKCVHYPQAAYDYTIQVTQLLSTISTFCHWQHSLPARSPSSKRTRTKASTTHRRRVTAILEIQKGFAYLPRVGLPRVLVTSICYE